MSKKVRLPAPRIEWWTPQPKLFNYREIAANGEEIGGGANQGFSSWKNVEKNIKAQAKNKGIHADISANRDCVVYSSGVDLPIFKVEPPKK